MIYIIPALTTIYAFIRHKQTERRIVQSFVQPERTSSTSSLGGFRGINVSGEYGRHISYNLSRADITQDSESGENEGKSQLSEVKSRISFDLDVDRDE